MSRKAKSSRVNVEGEIDATHTSYFGDDEKHGKTVDATDPVLGKEETDYLPDSVDGDNLSKTQERIVALAAMNTEASTYDIAEMIDDEDVTANTVGYVLRTYAEEWYKNVFKQEGMSARKGGDRTGRQKVTDEDIISVVEEEEGITANGLSDEVDISYGWANTRLSELEDEGYLRSETGVPGYDGRTRVFFLADDEDTIEEQTTSSLGDLFDGVSGQTSTPTSTSEGEQEPEETSDLGDLLPDSDIDEDGTDDDGSQEDEGDSTKEKDTVTLTQDEVDDILLLCDFVEDSESADPEALAQYVRERLE